MIIMDVKGITWVGNVYQKFEAMCLEVEEVMYQDTVKYVENQVQTVGASVKKFYSDVMQDLLPPISQDSEKVSPCGFTGKQDSDDGISKKSNVTKKAKPARADDELLTRTLKVTSDNGKDTGLAPSIHVRLDVDNLCRPSGESVTGACSNLRSRKKYHHGSVHKSSSSGVGENRCDKKLIPTERSCAITHEKCLRQPLSSYGEFVNEIQEVSSDQTAPVNTPSVNEDTRSDSKIESCDEIETVSEYVADFSSSFQSSSEIILIKPIRDDGNEMEVQSGGGLSAKSNDKCLNSSLASSGGSLQNVGARYDKYADEEVFGHHPRKSFDWILNIIESEIATEHGTKTIEQSDKGKLEETCVLVNEDELHILPQREGKWRPYKKKIQEALYLRMRSARKQEYERLALQYGDDKKMNQEFEEALAPTLTMEEIKKLPHNDSCESEWELL